MPSILEIVPATEDTTIAQCKIMHAAQMAAHDAAMSIFDELKCVEMNMPVEVARTATLIALLSAVGHILADMPDQTRAQYMASRSHIAISHEHQHWRERTTH